MNRILYAIKAGLHYRKVFLHKSRIHKKGTVFYNIYGKHDKKIPYKPWYSVYYFNCVPCTIGLWLMLFPKASKTEFKKGIDGFRELIDISADVYQNVPTTIPRFKKELLALWVIHKMLSPINCCPSVHTSSALYCYSMAAKHNSRLIGFYKKEFQTTVNTIIFSKLHSLADVAFGMLAAAIVLEKQGITPDIETLLSGVHKDIPCNKIRETYEYGYELIKQGKDLKETVRDFFEKKGYEKVNEPFC